MPKASRSFHYWQPAPRWSPLPLLANPGYTAMGGRRREKAGTRHTDKTVEGKGEGQGKQPRSRVPVPETQMLEESTDNVKQLERLVAQEHVEYWRMHRSKHR